MLEDVLKPTAFSSLADQSGERSLEPYDLADQDRDHWCWVAVSISIAQKLDSLKEADQCKIVRALRTCTGCDDPLCNVPGNIQEAFKQQDLDAEVRGRAPAMDTIFTEIDEGRPIACRVNREPGRSGSLPHAVVIVGCVVDEGIVEIRDPTKGYKYWEDIKFLDVLEQDCVDHYLVVKGP